MSDPIERLQQFAAELRAEGMRRQHRTKTVIEDVFAFHRLCHANAIDDLVSESAALREQNERLWRENDRLHGNARSLMEDLVDVETARKAVSCSEVERSSEFG